MPQPILTRIFTLEGNLYVLNTEELDPPEEPTRILVSYDGGSIDYDPFPDLSGDGVVIMRESISPSTADRLEAGATRRDNEAVETIVTKTFRDRQLVEGFNEFQISTIRQYGDVAYRRVLDLIVSELPEGATLAQVHDVQPKMTYDNLELLVTPGHIGDGGFQPVGPRLTLNTGPLYGGRL